MVEAYRQDRAEDLLDHCDGLGILGEDDGGLHEVTNRVIGCGDQD